MKIVAVVGARPNFMKMAPLLEEMTRHLEIEPLLVHTGQHYDNAMSQQFFDELGMPKPAVDLGVGSGSHAAQTAAVMLRLEPVLVREKPDLVLVVGDVNSTMAAAVTAAKLGIPVAHVEAGLRSFDRTMPEEINRVVTDALSDYLFTTERSADVNLLREGIPPEKIHFVGNVMIDTLLKLKRRADAAACLARLGLRNGAGTPARQYAVLTLHRSSNVDDPAVLCGLLAVLAEVAEERPIVFPCHPRTRKEIAGRGFGGAFELSSGVVGERGLYLLEPLGYLDFIQLMSHAAFVLTDSGGIQEETTVLGVPCLTLRHSTERPVTVEEGTNTIVGTSSERIRRAVAEVSRNGVERRRAPELWDGLASRRIVDTLVRHASTGLGRRGARLSDAA